MTSNGIKGTLKSHSCLRGKQAEVRLYQMRKINEGKKQKTYLFFIFRYSRRKYYCYHQNTKKIMVPSNHSFFQYCYRNIGLFLIAPCKVITLNTLCTLFGISSCFFFMAIFLKLLLFQGDSEKITVFANAFKSDNYCCRYSWKRVGIIANCETLVTLILRIFFFSIHLNLKICNSYWLPTRKTGIIWWYVHLSNYFSFYLTIFLYIFKESIYFSIY